MAVMRDTVWHLELVEPPRPLNVLTVARVRDSHLRSPNGELEDCELERLIAAAYRMAERTTRRALAVQRWRLVMDRFPCGEIVLPPAPLISVESIDYVDAAGVDQEYAGSPPVYQVTRPTGPQAGRGRIRPAYGTFWPSTRSVPDAVTVEFRAGYGSGTGSVPDDILHGMLLVIGELYKQRSESVHAFNQNPALIRARDLWLGYRLY